MTRFNRLKFLLIPMALASLLGSAQAADSANRVPAQLAMLRSARLVDALHQAPRWHQSSDLSMTRTSQSYTTYVNLSFLGSGLLFDPHGQASIPGWKRQYFSNSYYWLP